MFVIRAKFKSYIILISSFLIIFFYYLNYPLVSAKGVVLNIGLKSGLKNTYIIWGLLNDYIYNFFNYFFGNFISDINLWEIIIAFQVAAFWSITIRTIIIHSNIFSLLVFFNPFILDYFALCTRDSITLSLIFLIGFKGWDFIKLFSAFIITFIHIGLLPLYITSALAFIFRKRSKRFFILISLISIFSSILIHLLLRYTDIISILPEGSYRLALEYPRIGFTNQRQVSDILNLAYNATGSFNLKILSFGTIGQIFCIAFKNKFPNNTFAFCFSSFFICSILSSVPNANRYIYHPILIAFPFLISFSLDLIHIQLRKLHKQFL